MSVIVIYFYFEAGGSCNRRYDDIIVFVAFESISFGVLVDEECDSASAVGTVSV